MFSNMKNIFKKNAVGGGGEIKFSLSLKYLSVVPFEERQYLFSWIVTSGG